MQMPTGSALLSATWLLLAGGYGRIGRRQRILVLGWLGAILLCHFASAYVGRFLPLALVLLALGAAPQLRDSLQPLALSALSAATAAVLLIWPAAQAEGLDPILSAGCGAAAIAALLAPRRAVLGVAAFAALLGGYLLTTAPDLGSASPDLEGRFQLLGAAGVLGVALGWIRDRVRRPLGGVARG